MAQRRMIARSVYTRTKFLRLSTIAKMLYTYLILEADDDGVSEAFFVMLTVGANEDNLQELVSSEFVTVVNDDLVVLINDWLEQNLVPKDRYTPSVYSAELEKRGFVRLERGFLPPDSNMVTNRKQNVTNAETQDRLVQDRLVQDRLVQDNSGEFNSKKGKKDEDEEGGAGGTQTPAEKPSTVPSGGDEEKNAYGHWRNVFLTPTEYNSLKKLDASIDTKIEEFSKDKKTFNANYDSDYEILMLRVSGGKNG